MAEPSWTDAEPGPRALAAEISRLWARAWRHRWLVLGTSALVAASSGVAASRLPARDPVKLTLRMTEGNPGSTPALEWTNLALRGYVTEVVFSQAALVEVMQRRRLIPPGASPSDAVAAVTELREAITVNVFQNHVIALVERRHRLRSAYITIGVRYATPEQDLALITDLADLVVSTGGNHRRQQIQIVARRTAEAVQQARVELARMRKRIAVLEPLARTNAEAAAELVGTRQGLRAEETRVERLETAHLQADLDLHLELQRPGLEIDKLDPVLPATPLPGVQRVLAAAALMAPLSLPFCALFIGAFDRRIYSPKDIERLGMSCIGHIAITPASKRARHGPGTESSPN